MDLVLVRHGEPMRGMTGADAVDPWLSEAGWRHAELVTAALLDEGLTALWTSPMRRARETAEVLATAVGLTPVVDEDLAEFDRGSAYLHYEDMTAESPYAKYLRGDLSPWGTTADEFRKRVGDAVGRIVEAHPGGRVAVVAHGGVFNALLGSILQTPTLHFHEPAYGSISRVRISRSGTRSVMSMNETAHVRLKEAMR